MKASIFLLLLLEVAYSIAFNKNNGAPPPCFSEVYCYGPLLETVQMSRIFNDSKTFVDMKMKSSPKKMPIKFFKFMAEHKNHPNQAQIHQFVARNFESSDRELLKWKPEDWTGNPKFLEKVRDSHLKKWGYQLNERWKSLGRKINIDVLVRQNYYSMIWVPEPVVLSDASFREFYYRDSYWTIQGLLLSEMFSTARGMLTNFLYLVNKHGHVPQGNRVYYLGRSQLPLLTPMIKLYLDATDDLAFIEQHINILESEFDYWIQHRTKNIQMRGKTYTLATYEGNWKGPRPEFYYEDARNAEFLKEEEEKEAFYTEIKAAAESGWDFSSRWLISNKTNQGNVTRSIIPVDLNAVMFWNAKLLWDFNEILGHKNKVAYFKRKAEDWLEAVTDVLWHEDLGIWLDYDLQNSIRREQLYLPNVAPLWTGCYPEVDKERMVGGVVQYLNKQSMPPSLNTGEYPEIWPTLQYMLVVGLRNTKLEEADELALKLAESWIKKEFIDSLIEKYKEIVQLNNELGLERKVQLGPKWNIGVILALLDLYGNDISIDDKDLNYFQLNRNLLFNLAVVSVILIVGVCAYICALCFRKSRTVF